jgi:hypothetical protein
MDQNSPYPEDEEGNISSILSIPNVKRNWMRYIMP